jgi:phosphate butyryltransferase
MKGLVDTSIILKEVLNRDYGLRTDNILSHVMICELPKFDRLIFLSDGAMNIDPTIEQLKQITLNAVSLARSLNISRPKVALLSAKEKPDPKMPSTLKCQAIQDMYERGEIVRCDICGPLAVDLALDKEAAKIKNIRNNVAGQADILIAPYIEVANALYKGWVFGCEGVKSAGIVIGAKNPIVLTSRADSHESKLYSIALSVLMEN